MKLTKNAFYILLIALLMPFYMQAQPPGYLGKRGFISLGLSSKPTLNGPTTKGKSFFDNSDEYVFATRSIVAIDYELELNLSYVVGRQQLLGLTLGRYNTGLFSDAETIAMGVNPENFSSEIDRHDLFQRLSSTSVSFVYSKFKSNKGGLAPLGNHVVYGLRHTSTTGSITDMETRYHFDRGEAAGHRSLGIDDERVGVTSFLIGWSNNQIFYDKLILKLGFRFGIPLNKDVWNVISDGRIDGYSRTGNTEAEFIASNQARFRNNVYDRVSRHEVLRMDISVGYLLF